MSKDSNPHNHILPLKLYINVGLALFALTVITVAVAQVHLGPFNMVVAMVIAGTKAMLVALFFMHLKYDNKLFLSIFVSGILFLVLFIVFTMFDTERRGDIEAFKADRINAAAAMYDAEGRLALDTTQALDTTDTGTALPDSATGSGAATGAGGEAATGDAAAATDSTSAAQGDSGSTQ